MIKKFSKITIATLTLLFSTGCESEIKNAMMQSSEIAGYSALDHFYYSSIDDLILRAEKLGEVITIHTSADFPHYASIDDLALRATDIVKVEALDERVEMINTWLPPQNELEDAGGGFREAYEVFTVHRFKILEVFQGYKEVGDILDVKQMGGQLGSINLINHDKVMFNTYDDLILFLESYDVENMPASLLNPFQSAYRFTPTNADARMRNVNDELQSISSQNDLILTLDDLARISANRLD